MLSLFVFVVGLAAAETPNNFVAVEWTTHSDGTVYLVPLSNSVLAQQEDFPPNRIPAGQDLPPPAQEDTPPQVVRPAPEYKPPYKNKYAGLGKFGCIKRGYLDAGEGDVSNKYIAMVAVRSKDRNDNSGLVSDARDRQIMRESIYTLSAIGSCKGSGYRFTKSEAQRSAQWLNAPRVNVSKAEYQSVFQMKRTSVDSTISNYEQSPERVQRNWDYLNDGTLAHKCAKPLEKKKRIRLCQMISRACGIQEVGCERGNYELRRPPGGASDGGDGPGGPGGDGPGGSTTGNGETGDGNNENSGHGANNGGKQGQGPGSE